MAATLTKVMIMAGGTGGHVFPGLAVAEYLRERGALVMWLGTEHGIESRVVPVAGFDLDTIRVQGLRGKGVLGWIMLPVRMITAMTQATRILWRRKPAAVLALGGFVAGPGAVMAWIMRKPLLIHEQNAKPGLTNRLLSVIARKVLCGFPDAFAERPGSRHVGNPVRADIAAIAPPEERLANRTGHLRLLVIGGSQGARALNHVVPEALALLPGNQHPKIWHQTGVPGFQHTQEAYQGHQGDARVDKFIDDMKSAYEWADVVLCRAGAMTVSELAAAGVASILVPFPFATDDHQTANAEFLVARNAAILVPEKELTPTRLRELIVEFQEHRKVLLEMAVHARACATPDAVEIIGELCLEMANA